jgi:hypothetical protein
MLFFLFVNSLLALETGITNNTVTNTASYSISPSVLYSHNTTTVRPLQTMSFAYSSTLTPLSSSIQTVSYSATVTSYNSGSNSSNITNNGSNSSNITTNSSNITSNSSIITNNSSNITSNSSNTSIITSNISSNITSNSSTNNAPSTLIYIIYGCAGGGILLLCIFFAIVIFLNNRKHSVIINSRLPVTETTVTNPIAAYDKEPNGLVLAEGWQRYSDANDVWYCNSITNESSWVPVYRNTYNSRV